MSGRPGPRQTLRTRRAGVLSAVLVLTLVALSGCFTDTNDSSLDEDGSPEDESPLDDPDQDTPPTDGGDSGPNGPKTPSDALDQQIEFVDCAMLAVAYIADETTSDLLLPEGYSSEGWLGPGATTVNLEHYDCKAVIINNQTVLHDVAYSLVVTFVDPPDELERPNTIDVYIFEWLTDHPAFYALLAEHGAPVQMASIELNVAADSPEAEAHVSVDGNEWYRTTTHVRAGEVYELLPWIRNHHYLDDDVSAWALFNYTGGEHENLGRNGVTEVDGGALRDFPWASGGLVVGASQYGSNGGFVEFGRLEE